MSSTFPHLSGASARCAHPLPYSYCIALGAQCAASSVPHIDPHPLLIRRTRTA